MKLMTAAVFGIGYVLGTRAGQDRYQQIRAAAITASERFDIGAARRQLEKLTAQLDDYASSTSSRRPHRP